MLHLVWHLATPMLVLVKETTHPVTTTHLATPTPAPEELVTTTQLLAVWNNPRQTVGEALLTRLIRRLSHEHVFEASHDDGDRDDVPWRSKRPGER